jgi:hypothetical protein
LVLRRRGGLVAGDVTVFMHIRRAGAEGLITATIRQRAQTPPEDASRG